MHPSRSESNRLTDHVQTTALRPAQHIKRPQLQQKPKPRPSGAVISRAPVLNAANSTDGNDVQPTETTTNYKPTHEDWARAEAEDEEAVAAYQASLARQRGGGRNARKRQRQKEKAAQEAAEAELADWDAIYDPSKPTSIEAYQGSTEEADAVAEWKDWLARGTDSDALSIDDSDASRSDVDSLGDAGNASDEDRRMSRPTGRDPAFAPPIELSFAPPALYDEDGDGETAAKTTHVDDDEPYEPPPPPPPPPPPAANVPADTTADDAYARRLAMSGGARPPSPPPLATTMDEEEEEDYEPTPPPPPPPPPAPDDALPPADTSTPQKPSTISRAPVRYDMPPPEPNPATPNDTDQHMPDAPPSTDPTDAPAPRSTRPGQKGFAQRLLAKYGWQQGSGLGAQGTGIATPLSVQLDKRKKNTEGVAGPSGRIVGGKKSKEAQAQEAADQAAAARFGALSPVILIERLTDGMDLETELHDGGLVQEVGDECGALYGVVERVYIQRRGEGRGRTFVKFASELSALRALQGLQGRAFGGNEVAVRYFDVKTFEGEVLGS